MPNHVEIALTIAGPKDRVAHFVEKAKEKGPESQPISFHQFVPVPQGLIDRSFGAEKELREAEENGTSLERFDGFISRYDWQNCHWGTKWDTYDVQEPKIEDTIATYVFTCAWGPPVAFVENVSIQYPECTFYVSYGGEGPCLGKFAFHNGICLIDKAGSKDGDQGPEYPHEIDEKYESATPEEKEKLNDLENEWGEAYSTWEKQYLISHDEWVNQMKGANHGDGDTERVDGPL